MSIADNDCRFIDQIRASSRQMVRELGFMQATLATTDYAPSAVHAILEIGANDSMTAAQLSELLGLEKSSVSRMVRKLVEAGELSEVASDEDGRVKWLTLSAKGKLSLAAIQTFGRGQVSSALTQLAAWQHQAVADGLAAYAQALQAHRLGQRVATTQEIHIVEGYQPGAIGQIVQMHGAYYARTVGFGSMFESKVAAGIAELVPRLEHARNGLWLAMQGERIVGSVAIDGEDLGGNQGHLRWFIVDDGLRGAGVGRQLMDAAMAFCDAQRFVVTQLWTFKGLDAARKLYEQHGFALKEESPGSQWGKQMLEQRFERVPR